VQAAISEVSATSVSDLSKVMKVVMPKIKGRANGAMVKILAEAEFNKTTAL
jgi:uncharacterized protein YqeY